MWIIILLIIIVVGWTLYFMAVYSGEPETGRKPEIKSDRNAADGSSPEELNRRAMESYSAGNYAVAASCARKSAETGDAQGMCLYSSVLLGGNGVQQDIPRAVEFMTKSAEAGYIPALMSLSNWYRGGSFVGKKDVKKSFELMKIAADSGYAEAERELGLMYAHAIGTEENLSKAHFWLEKAANQDDTEAQYQLGLMHGIGVGVESSMEKAYYWFAKAADLGHEKAIKNCEEMLADCGEK